LPLVPRAPRNGSEKVRGLVRSAEDVPERRVNVDKHRGQLRAVGSNP